MVISDRMNPLDLTINQLKRAAAIKGQIEALNKDLRGILGVSAKPRKVPKKKPTMSAFTGPLRSNRVGP